MVNLIAAGARGGPIVRARPLSAASDRSSRIDNLLSHEEQTELATIATVLNYRRTGAAIFAEGENAHFLYAIQSGVVRISEHDKEGSRQIIAFMWPGDLIGLAERGRYISSADTASPAVLYRFPLQKLHQLLERQPRLRLHLLAKALHDLRSAQRRIVVLGQLTVPQRLGSFLYEMAQHHEVYDAKSRCLNLLVNRFDIADYLGTSPEHVARAFAILERDKIVKRRTSRLIDILNIEALANHARWPKVQG